ncbi:MULTISPECIES: hypothetical protein [Cyanophyceae]|uniref:GapS4b family protein n=1 Tax=Cyanophyceae TaxID=3028117 RepID=UPI0016858FF6|nr:MULTISPECIES: hypothetical protein [Cyanophyceae]MBD1916871.1 hypothetical protein [Phormidium sp. FACHB-77]MBD2028882.1 hypothetical protein [Phormidium sp. FACHB-322]MBD2051567.1 hypothetical protein [Leptolyngbya sp. FACHB-60]
MNKNPESIDKMLPHGEMLRTFMEQSFVGKGDLKNLLRNRGVFTFEAEKKDTIPILSLTLLSPGEFDYLRECQNTKEDNPKVITRTVRWESEDNIFSSCPGNFNVSAHLNLEFSNYQVVGDPILCPVDSDPEHVKMDFDIERKDLSKSWATDKSTFPGSVEFKKLDNDEIKLTITYTSSETKQVASKLAENLVKEFKSKGHINSSTDVEKILFSSFTNPNRISYLLSLMRNCDSSMLEFIDVVDVGFSPEPGTNFPEKIDWMESKIEDLKLNGKELHDTFFLKDPKYHDCIHLYGIYAKFKFFVRGTSGKCVMSASFPDYERTKNLRSEMEIDIRSLSFDDPPRGGGSRVDIKQLLLRAMEEQKIKQFRVFGNSATSKLD